MQTLRVPLMDGMLDACENFWTEACDQPITSAYILRVYLNMEANGKIYGCERILVGKGVLFAYTQN